MHSLDLIALLIVTACWPHPWHQAVLNLLLNPCPILNPGIKGTLTIGRPYCARARLLLDRRLSIAFFSALWCHWWLPQLWRGVIRMSLSSATADWLPCCKVLKGACIALKCAVQCECWSAGGLKRRFIGAFGTVWHHKPGMSASKVSALQKVPLTNVSLYGRWCLLPRYPLGRKASKDVYTGTHTHTIRTSSHCSFPSRFRIKVVAGPSNVRRTSWS